MDLLAQSLWADIEQHSPAGQDLAAPPVSAGAAEVDRRGTVAYIGDLAQRRRHPLAKDLKQGGDPPRRRGSPAGPLCQLSKCSQSVCSLPLDDTREPEHAPYPAGRSCAVEKHSLYSGEADDRRGAVRSGPRGFDEASPFW